MSLRGVTAVFLCGGIGKRMLPLTEEKFLFRFMGKTLLERQIETARKAGINDFVVVSSPESAERVKSVLGGVPLAIQREPKGMADALLSARELLDGKEIVVINPNDVIDASAYESVAKCGSSCILGCEVGDYFPGGYIELDGDNLKSIVEKPGSGNEPSNMINIVVHLHRDTGMLFRALESAKTDKDDAYEKALDGMAKQEMVKVARYTGRWIPIKYPWHVLAAARHFLSGAERSISDTARISEHAVIEGNVVIGDNVRVMENAVIRGPCFIGSNSVIGNSALLRNAHIGENCVVGYNTEIKNTFIGNNNWFHSNYIGDSVIGDGCNFGAGTVIANFRLDEKTVHVNVKGERLDTGLDKFGAVIGNNSKTGVNASIMPGVKIGPNSFVGPNVCLSTDLAPNKMILPDSEYSIMDNKVELSDSKMKLMKRLGAL